MYKKEPQIMKLFHDKFTIYAKLSTLSFSPDPDQIPFLFEHMHGMICLLTGYTDIFELIRQIGIIDYIPFHRYPSNLLDYEYPAFR
jgi:hypothetical protein